METSRPNPWSLDYNPGRQSHLWLILIPICFVFGSVFIAAGIFLHVAAHGAEKSAGLPWYMPLFFDVGGVGVAFFIPACCFRVWYHGAPERIVCGPEGFRKEVLSRKAPRTVVYRWNDVTATRCGTHDISADDGASNYIQTFLVTTADGESTEFNSLYEVFAEVINAYNAMTPHLPYVWLPRQPRQDWEHANEPPGSPNGQLRRVEPQAKYVCAPRSHTAVVPPPPPVPPTPPSLVPPPLPGWHGSR